MQAHPSLPAAQTYLAARAPRIVLYNGTKLSIAGYELYFTVLGSGDRAAVRVKVCEDVHGHVTGSSNISNGEPSC